MKSLSLQLICSIDSLFLFVSCMKPTSEICNSSHFLLIQVEEQPTTTISYLVKTRGLCGGSNSLKQLCWGTMCVSMCCSRIWFFFFKSRKHNMLLRLWRLQSQEFETGFSRIKAVSSKITELIAWRNGCSLLFTNFFMLNFATLIFF